MILQRPLWIEKPRTTVDGHDFYACAAAGAIFQPGHQQVTPATAVFQDIASELGGDRCNHRNVGGPE